MSFSLSIPELPGVTLSDAEEALLQRLQTEALRHRRIMEITQAYYLGEQVIRNLRIAVPKELEFLRTIVGWPALAVDPYVERLFVEGFLLPNATDADSYLGDLWAANGLDAEFPLAVTDALSMGRGWWMVGSPAESGGAPMVTVESPLNVAALWNLRGTEPEAALQEYWKGGRRHAAIYTPEQTIHLATDDAVGLASGKWEVVDRDQHGFGRVPIVQMPNRPRSASRDGRSEISPAIRSVTDSACRTLLGLEVARELYSVPQKLILGATESDFVDASGSAKSAWETYVTSVLALERDENGDLPEVKQLTVYDPSTFTKLIDMYASQMASLTCAPPQDLGLYTQGNPVSAEQVDSSEERRNRRARLMQATFGVAVTRVMQLAVRFENGGDLPAEFARISVDWRDVEEPSMAQISDALGKQIDAQMVPAQSDVVLKRAGYSAVERRRLEQDREAAQGDQILNDLAARASGEQPNANAG